MILPSRAIFLTVRDTLCEARRLGLKDSVQAARRSLSGFASKDEDAAAVLETMWEAVSCLELAANVAALWVDPQLPAPNGRWAEATLYDPTRANRFFESSHNWTDERFAALSAHRVYGDGDASMLELLNQAGFEDQRFSTAFEEAEASTTKFLRESFQRLADGWQFLKGYAPSYEHGLVLVPSAYGEAVDAHEESIPVALIVTATRKDAGCDRKDTRPRRSSISRRTSAASRSTSPSTSRTPGCVWSNRSSSRTATSTWGSSATRSRTGRRRASSPSRRSRCSTGCRSTGRSRRSLSSDHGARGEVDESSPPEHRHRRRRHRTPRTDPTADATPAGPAVAVEIMSAWPGDALALDAPDGG
jgi:hypothetical protein